MILPVVVWCMVCIERELSLALLALLLVLALSSVRVVWVDISFVHQGITFTFTDLVVPGMNIEWDS